MNSKKKYGSFCETRLFIKAMAKGIKCRIGVICKLQMILIPILNGFQLKTFRQTASSKVNSIQTYINNNNELVFEIISFKSKLVFVSTILIKV